MDVDKIIAGLSEVEKVTLSSIHEGALDGFRTNEGERPTLYNRLCDLGLLGKEKFVGMYTMYYITPLGLAVRARLLGEG